MMGINNFQHMTPECHDDTRERGKLIKVNDRCYFFGFFKRKWERDSGERVRERKKETLTSLSGYVYEMMRRESPGID